MELSPVLNHDHEIDLSAKLWEITTRWDLRTVHERVGPGRFWTVRQSRFFAPRFCIPKMRELVKHIRKIGTGLGKSSRHCVLGVRCRGKSLEKGQLAVS